MSDKMICNKTSECDTKCRVKTPHRIEISCMAIVDGIHNLCGNELSKFYCKKVHCVNSTKDYGDAK